MAEHNTLTGASLHETKGADTASADTVHKANGAGATSWSKITSSNLDASSIFNTNKFQLMETFTDVSTADIMIFPIVKNCILTKVTTVLHAAITSADSTLTLTNSAGATTIGSITISYSGSAPGDVHALTTGSNNTFTAGSYLKIATDGASSTTAKLSVVCEFTQTG
jgi:hypothetical protein